MKKILVPTDFSSNADNALDFALNIGKKLEAEVKLLHTYQVNQSALVFKDVAGMMRREAEENLENTLARHQEQLTGPIILSGDIIMGSATQLTTKCAEQKECDLIVMGTQGATGALEVFIGSVTGTVLKHTKRPVLAIPAGFTYQPFQNIVLAIDNLPLSPEEVFQPLRMLASVFGARISVFHLKTDEGAGVDRRLESYLEGLQVTFHETTDGERDVHHHINEFVKTTDADLLCMVRRRKGFFEGLFKGSSTLKQVYNSPVPLLVLIDES